MGRQNFSEGQEVLAADLIGISQCVERGLYEKVLYEMTGRQSGSAFFGNSFYVRKTGAVQVQVLLGNGIQYDSAQTSPETKRRLVYSSANQTVNLTAAHATLNRIDVISVKSNLLVASTANRNFKDVSDSTVALASTTVRYDWDNTLVTTTGTAGASPSAPATPSGYTKLAEVYVTAVSGIANQAAITDSRTLIKMGRFQVLWYPVNGVAPTTAEENLILSDLFELNAGQQLTASIKVPENYIAGQPLKINVSAYSPSSTNNWALTALTTLIRAGTDALTSTTNQNTGTSGDITNTLANQLRKIPLDLTDYAGQVNSVSVSPGDMLIVKLTRSAISAGSDDTADIRIVDGGSEGVF